MRTQTHGSRLRSLPLWASAALTHVAVRLAMLPAMATLPSIDHHRSFLSWFSIVDGYWYRRIALHGYPHDLVVNPATGDLVKPTTVAFYPVFPFTVRAIMTVTRLPFSVAGPLTGFLYGLAAMVVVAYLIRTAAGPAVARRPELPILAVVALDVFPTGAVLSFAYSEGVGLLLIALALLLVARRRYLWAALPVLVLGFTRAVALPMVAVLLWHVLVRMRSGDRPTVRERVEIGTTVVVGLVSAFAWPFVAGRLEDDGSAFFKAQSYYRDGGDATAPFRGFLDRLEGHLPPAAAVLAIAVLVVVVLALSFAGPVRELGPELQAWGGAYLVYLIAVSDLDASGMRFLLLAITPAVLLVSWWRRRVIGYVLLGLMVIGQYLWVYGVWGDGFSLHLGP